MRADSVEFENKKSQLTQEPRFVVEVSFDLANTDTHRISSHQIDDLPTPLTQDALRSVSSSSQKLNPDKANSTIGGIKFEVLDIGITDILRAKLNENKGLRGKRVRIYKGFKGFSWSQYRLIGTYIISGDVSVKGKAYTFSCSDVQRTMKKKIFTETTSPLLAPISATDTEIDVLDASKFTLVYQVPSVSGRTLLSGMQVRVHPPGHENAGSLVYPELTTPTPVTHIALIRIPGEDSTEVAMVTGKTGNKLTGVYRGVLGTTPVDVEIESGITTEDAPKISEYVYINMPAVKAVWGIYTGAIYGAPGEFFPDHWHLGISTDYIKTSAFINIGTDLWDLSDDDEGFPVYIAGQSDVEAKKFIEEKIYYMLGLYSPINSEGEIGLKRMQYIGPNDGYSKLLDETNVHSHTGTRYDTAAILNSFLLKWNWDAAREEYTRTSGMYDPISVLRNKVSDVKVTELDTLHGSVHSDATIRSHFNALRARYAGPPLLIDVVLTPDMDGIEVGDNVRLKLKNEPDFTNESGPLNRNYEVQQVSIDTKTGRIKLKLFGSSQRASDIPPENPATPADAFLISEGMEINNTNFPSSGITKSGNTTTITGLLDLAGDLDLTNPNAIYKVDGDLVINASAVVSITNNVQLRVNGFMQVNGLITGKGKGYAGGIADNDEVHNFTAPLPSNLGIPGIGTTHAQDGVLLFALVRAHKRIGSTTVGTAESLPSPKLTIVDGVLKGLPSSLMGTSGSSGGAWLQPALSSSYIGSFPRTLKKGGDGGAGGGGLAIFSKGGAYGSQGEINLSGGDGTLGIAENPFVNIASGAGAGGAPGSLLLITVDSSQSFLDRSPANVKLNYGICPKTESAIRQATIWNSDVPVPPSPPTTFDYFDVGYSDQGEDTNTADSNAHIVFLDTPSGIIKDPAPYVEYFPTFTLTENLNTPSTPAGDRSSIEVSVTRPIFNPGEVDNYSYSLVDYRKVGATTWIEAQPASPESVVDLKSDGSVYEFRIRAVSTSKNVSGTGPIKTITLTNIGGLTDSELAVIYPFSALTGLKIQGEPGNTFTGMDANFEWPGDNNNLTYFNYYTVEIWSGAQLLRTEKTVSPFFVYSHTKNLADYYAQNTSGGVYFSITIKVKTVSKYFNDVSDLYSSVFESFTVSASTINEPTNLRFWASGGSGGTVDYSDPRISNGAVTINPDGTLNGAGGGQVTPEGIGAETPSEAQAKADAALAAAQADATSKAAAAQSAAISAAAADAEAKRVAAEAYADGIVTQAEADAIAAAAADATSKANAAQSAAISAAAADATSKAAAAQSAAISAAAADAEAKRVAAEAYADGIVTQAEADAIAAAETDATNKANAAAAAAIAAAAADATSKAAAAAASAATDATAKANAAQAAAVAAAKNYADINFATQTSLATDIGTLQTQIDGNATIWFYSGIPTLANAPASTWPNNTVRDGHINDLYFDDVTKFAYRYIKTGSVYSWERQIDNDLISALDQASNAQDTADNKRRVFVVTPTGPYDIGDLWTVGTRVRRATVGRATGFLLGEWVEIATVGATWEGNIAGQPNRQMILNNQVDVSDWDSGGSIPLSLSTSPYGYATASSLVVAPGPTKFDDVCWQVKAVNVPSDDGGFGFTTSVIINPAKVYRASCWVKSSTTNGTLRFSPSNNSTVRTLNTNVVQSQPYQFNAAPLVANRWYLVIMVVHPHNTTRTTSSGLSGIYDPVTGDILAFFDEFKFTATATFMTSGFHYIDIGDTTSTTLFTRPRLEVMDGGEQSMAGLLGFADTLYVKREDNPTMLNVRADGVKLSGASNISVSRVAAGQYRITHGTGYSGKGIIISPRLTTIFRSGVISETPTYFDVGFYHGSGALTDTAFTLLLNTDYGY